FSSAVNPESDFITNFTLGLGAGYQSVPFTLVANFVVNPQVYAKNSELNTWQNQTAGLTLNYLPDQRWTLGLGATYQRFENTGDFLIQQPTPTPTPPPVATTGAQPPGSTPSTSTAGAPPPSPTPTTTLPAVDIGRTKTTSVTASAHVGYKFNPTTN